GQVLQQTGEILRGNPYPCVLWGAPDQAVVLFEPLDGGAVEIAAHRAAFAGGEFLDLLERLAGAFRRIDEHEQLLDAVVEGLHAALDAGIVVEDADRIVVQVWRRGPDADQARRAVIPAAAAGRREADILLRIGVEDLDFTH